MAENKTSFVLYSDQRTLIDLLSNEQAGKLLKHIYAYVNDENPICEDVLINVAFEPIKQQFKRDLKKWERTKESRSKAGLASAEARKNKQNSTNSTNVKCVQQSSTNPTVNVNDNVNVNVNVNDIKDNSFSFDSFWNIYDKKIDKTKCEVKFNKLSYEEKEKIKVVLPKYINSTPEVKFRKNPLTWLNGKCWNDEVVEVKEINPYKISI